MRWLRQYSSPESQRVNNTKRSSPKFQNDSSNDGIDMSFIVDQMKYLYDTNMQLITIVKNLQSKYDIVAKNHNESNLINNDLKTELQSVETKIKTISEENKILKEKSSIIENFDNKL